MSSLYGKYVRSLSFPSHTPTSQMEYEKNEKLKRIFGWWEDATRVLGWDFERMNRLFEVRAKKSPECGGNKIQTEKILRARVINS